MMYRKVEYVNPQFYGEAYLKFWLKFRKLFDNDAPFLRAHDQETIDKKSIIPSRNASLQAVVHLPVEKN